MADAIHITPEVCALLARFFPRWPGDAAEPALPPHSPSKPLPPAAATVPVVAASHAAVLVATRELVEA
jgi:hypothetical protein